MPSVRLSGVTLVWLVSTTWFMRIVRNQPQLDSIDIIAGWGFDTTTCCKRSSIKTANVRLTGIQIQRGSGQGIQVRHVPGGGNPGRFCTYDSGGPLFRVASDGHWIAHGVISHSISSPCQTPQFSVNVRTYRPNLGAITGPLP